MGYLPIILAVGVLASVTFTSAHTTGRIRAFERKLHFMEGAEVHKVPIPWEHLWHAHHVERIYPVHDMTIDKDRYFVLQIEGHSKYPPGGGKCGGGWEVDLLWLHVDSTWQLKEVECARVESCWASLGNYDFGRDKESKQYYSKEQDVLISRTSHVREEVKLLYSFREPQIGFRVTTSSMISESEFAIQRKTFPEDVITTTEQKRVFGTSYFSDVARLRSKRAGFEQVYADFVEATWSDNHSASLNLLDEDHERYADAFAARLVDGTSLEESKKQWEQYDKELNEVYAALTSKLSGLQGLWLLVSQRRWIIMRDEVSRFAARIKGQRKNSRDYWTLSYLTQRQTQRLQQALMRPLPAQKETGKEYWQKSEIRSK